MSSTISSRIDPYKALHISRLILEEASKIIVGKKNILKMILIVLYSGGHILLEGVPGVAKTLIAKTISRTMNLTYSRIQATPDLLPSDIIGTLVFDPRRNDFITRKGPIFANIVLFDEINRASPRTQSALLEAMQERQVTIEGRTYKLPEPFMVIATMNPIEMEGTFPLPEAQLDRFMMKIIVDYPTREELKEILRRYHSIVEFGVKPVVSVSDILSIQRMITWVRVSEEIMDYIINLIDETHKHRNIRLGGSPRAAISLLLAAKANALIEGRDYVIPDDVKFVVKPVLRHRLLLTPEAEFEGVKIDDVIDEIMKSISVPLPGV
jgi:MoxR-like ATPase